MTSTELIAYFNNNFGISKPWPKEHRVDATTFSSVTVAVINYLTRHRIPYTNFASIDLIVGPNNGIMFKGVEIILDENSHD